MFYSCKFVVNRFFQVEWADPAFRTRALREYLEALDDDDSLDALEDQLEVALHTFEGNAPMVKSIVAWEWIV